MELALNDQTVTNDGFDTHLVKHLHILVEDCDSIFMEIQSLAAGEELGYFVCLPIGSKLLYGCLRPANRRSKVFLRAAPFDA